MLVFARAVLCGRSQSEGGERVERPGRAVVGGN